MRTSARVLLNAVSNWVGLGVSLAIGLLTVPIMLEQFGKEGYGLVGLCATIVSMRIVVDFGLRSALTRELAVVTSTGDKERFTSLVTTALTAYLVLGLVVVAVCYVSAPMLVDWFKVPPLLHETALFLIRFYAGPAFFVVLVSAPFSCVMTSNHRFDLLNYVTSGTSILRACGVLAVLLLSPWGLVGWAVVQIACDILQFVALTWTAHRLRPDLHLHLRKTRWRALPLATSASIFLLVLSIEISMMADSIILGATLGAGAVGLYTPGRMLSRRLRPVIDAIKDQLHPLATSRFASGKSADVRAILIEGTKYRLLMGVAACVGLTVFAPHIVHVWLGRSLLEAEMRTVSAVMICWAITDFFTYAGGSQWPVLYGMNEFRFLVIASLPLAALNLAASIYLAGFTRLGVIGVVIPSIISEALRVGVTFWYCCRRLQLPLRRYFMAAYSRPLVVMLALAVFAEITRRGFNPSTLRGLGACAALNGLAWVILAWRVGLARGDRENIGVLFGGAFRHIVCLRAWVARPTVPSVTARKTHGHK